MRLTLILFLAGCAGEVTTPCAMLAGSFSGGSARQSGDGWDVSACTLVASGDQYETLKPAERDPARFATARCNDGSPFAAQVRLAQSPSKVWVIYLEGGVYCDDLAISCSQRREDLTGTIDSADRGLSDLGRSGIFSRSATANPDFAAANHVLAHYCSSDLWAGATTERRPSTGDAAQGWYFSGRANLYALLALLAERYGLDDQDPSLRILFGGGSAGAFGAHFNSARVAERFPSTTAAGRLLLLVDAGWMFDGWDDPAHRLGMATLPDREVWTRAREFWGASFDPACEAAHGDPIDCFFGSGWLPHLKLPTLVQQSAADVAFMGTDNIKQGDPAITTWRMMSRASMATVPRLFSGAMPYHTLATTDAGLARGPSGSSLREVIGRFWAGGAAERVEF